MLNAAPNEAENVEQPPPPLFHTGGWKGIEKGWRHAVPRRKHTDRATDPLGLLGSASRGWLGNPLAAPSLAAGDA